MYFAGDEPHAAVPRRYRQRIQSLQQRIVRISMACKLINTISCIIIYMFLLYIVCFAVEPRTSDCLLLNLAMTSPKMAASRYQTQGTAMWTARTQRVLLRKTHRRTNQWLTQKLPNKRSNKPRKYARNCEIERETTRLCEKLREYARLCQTKYCLSTIMIRL